MQAAEGKNEKDEGKASAGTDSKAGGDKNENGSQAVDESKSTDEPDEERPQCQTVPATVSKCTPS